jgi:predicted ABC-type ATPase
MNPKEQAVCDAAVEFVKKHKKELLLSLADIQQVPTDVAPVAIFMAGSPGAGKTEFAEDFLKLSTRDWKGIVFIDPDRLRNLMPNYGGANAHLFQKAVSRLVSELYSCVLKQKQSFLLDGTMSSLGQAEQNIDRALRNGYQVYIFYVYQDPVSAWKFTQAREKTEGRRIKKDTFIQQFFAAPTVVNTIKAQYKKKVTVKLILKDIYHTTKQFEKNVDVIDNYIKHSYTEETLENLLHDAYDISN